MEENKKFKNGLLIIFVVFRVIIVILMISYYTGLTNSLITKSYVYEDNGIRYRLYTESRIAEVIKSPKASGKVIVPSFVINKNKQYVVTTIKENAFYNNNNIEEIHFSEGIKFIENYSISPQVSKISVPNSIELFEVSSINVDNMISFNNCEYLGNDENPYVVLISVDNQQIENVILNEGLKVIGPYAFCGCEKLTSIILPDSVVSIARLAFHRCVNLENLDISEDSNLEYIESECLSRCVSLKSLFIPKNCRYISRNFFNSIYDSKRIYKSKLEKIVVHSENPIYDSRNDCDAIIETKTNKLVLGCKNTVIPETVKTLGYGCFSGVLFNNTELILPNTIKEINSYAFAGSNITKIILNESCEELGSCAFSSCYELEELIINKNIKEIYLSICEYDTKLKKLVIPFIGKNFNSKGQLSYFFGSSSEDEFTNLSIYIRPKKNYVIHKNSIDIAFNEIYFLENVKEIKSKAFKIGEINNIYISNSVTKVGKNIINRGYSVYNSINIYLESANLGKNWNTNWNNIKAKLEYGYSFEEIYQELEVQNEKE